MTTEQARDTLSLSFCMQSVMYGGPMRWTLGPGGIALCYSQDMYCTFIQLQSVMMSLKSELGVPTVS